MHQVTFWYLIREFRFKKGRCFQIYEKGFKSVPRWLLPEYTMHPLIVIEPEFCLEAKYSEVSKQGGVSL